MPKWMTFAFALFLSLQVFSTEGKEVDHAISNYINAMGGLESLRAVRSVYMVGTVTSTDETQAFAGINTIANRLLKGQQVFESVASTDFNRNTVKTNMIRVGKLSKGLFKFSLNVDHCTMPLTGYDGQSKGMELSGKKKINGRQAFRLNVVLKPGQYTNYYLDAKSWYILREVRYTNPRSPFSRDAVEQIDYFYFIKVKQGVVFPSTIMLNQTGTVIKISNIQVKQ